jgi:hypothetical protein
MLDVEGCNQSLAEAKAKDKAMQQRLDAEEGSLQELELRIQQLLRREDNMQCIESRAMRHPAEVT